MVPPARDAVVVITGASSGIGKATAAAFAKQGARLVLCARRDAELQDTATECREAGVQVETVIVDVPVADQVQVLAAARLRRSAGSTSGSTTQAWTRSAPLPTCRWR